MKGTILAIMNKVLKKVGEPEINATSSITGIVLLAFDSINESLREIATENGGKLTFLETSSSISLTASYTGAYTLATDLVELNKNSFRTEDKEWTIDFVEKDQFDSDYPKVTDTGFPTKYTLNENKVEFDHIAASSDSAKLVKYRYWKNITQFTLTGSTLATSTATSEIPESIEDIVLVNMATFKVLSYQGDSEAQRYHLELYGDPRVNKEGSILKMRKIYRSPVKTKIRMTYNL